MTVRVAMTGRGGFIGSAIAGALNAEGLEVIAIRRRAAGERGIGVFGENLLALRGCDAVFHVAGLAHRDRRAAASAADYRVANADAVAEVALAARAAGLRRVILISSAGVLGWDSGSGCFNELSSPAPYDDYTRSKLLGETRLCAALDGSQTEWVILRLPMVIGRGAPGSWNRLVRWVQSGRPVPVSTPEARRSYVSIDSVIAYCRAALNSPALACRTLLLADEATVTLSQLVEWIAAGSGRSARTLFLPARLMKLLLALLGRSADWRRMTASFALDGRATWHMAGLESSVDLRRAVIQAAKTGLNPDHGSG